MDDINIIQKYRSTAGDAVSYYDAQFTVNPTLENFIRWIICNKPDEWGKVRLEGIIGPSIVEYSRGKVTSLCDEYENIKQKTIKLTAKYGGWGMMNYVIKFL